MAFVDITPVSGSIISRGAVITVRWDTAALPNIIYRPTSGPDEPISLPATSGAKLGSGYTGEYGVDASGPTPIYSIAFKRDAGWTNSGFVISVFDFWTGDDTLSNYTILAEGQYPPDMQPFTDPAEGAGEGTIQVLNSGVILGSAASINFDDNLVAVLNGDVATIDGEAGGGSTVGAVSGSIGIWSKGNTVLDTFNALTVSQTFDVENGSPFLTTKIRVASTVPLEGINAHAILSNLPLGYISFQDQNHPGLTASTFEILLAEDSGGTYTDLTVVFIAGQAELWSTSPSILVFTPKEIPGGVVDFTDLADVVQSYSGAGQQLVRVNAGETGLEYVAPGVVAGGEEVVGEVWIDGLGNAGVNTGTVGIADVDLTEDSGLTAKLTWSTPFASSAYFVQLTQAQVGGPGYNYQVVSGSKLPASAKVAVYDASGTPILLTSTAPGMNFAIIAQDGPSAGNVGRGMASFAFTGSSIGGEFRTTGGTLGSDIVELYFGADDDVGEAVDQSMLATQEGDIVWLRGRSTKHFLAWTMTGSIIDPGPGVTFFGLASVDGGANDLVFDETYDVGFIESGAAGGGGATDFNSVITVAPIDNVVDVPANDPIILRDGGVNTLAPLTVAKLVASSSTGNIELENPTGGISLLATDTTTGAQIRILPNGFSTGGNTTVDFVYGGGATSVAPGNSVFLGIGTVTGAQKGGETELRGGGATSGDGGDVVIDGGTSSSGAVGSIKIGEATPAEIVFGQGISIDDSSDPPLATTGAGKGQFWVNDATSPNKPYFTNEDDVDIDLTAGSGVGDVTSSSNIAANKIVIGDDGAKGVKEAPLGSLSDAGALTAIATIDTTGDITSGADLIATAALDVGTSAVIATDLTMTAGDVAMSPGATVDGRDVSVDGGNLDTHTALTDEHLDWSVTGAEQVHADRYTHTHETLVDVEEARILGRVSSGSGLSEELTAIQTRELLSVANVFIQASDPVASAFDGDIWIEIP